MQQSLQFVTSESSRDPEKQNIHESTINQSKDTSSKDDDSMTTVSDIDQNESEDSEDDDAFLARFDEDGNCIG